MVSATDGAFNLKLSRPAVAATDGAFNLKLSRPVGGAPNNVPTADGPSNFDLTHPIAGLPDSVPTPDSMFNFTLKRPVRDTPDGVFNFSLKRPIMAPPNKAADREAKEGSLDSVPSNAAAVPQKHSDKPFNFNLRRPVAAPLPITEAPPGTASEPMGLNSPQGQASDPTAKAYVPSRLSTHPRVADHYRELEWLDERLSFPRFEDSTKKEELDEVIAEVQNLSSRARDSAQALEFLRQEKMQFLFDVEAFLEVMGEIRDEMYAGTKDFMLSLQERS
ncbi:uncharacterized protein LACBIDRAFT_336086 [Laccaria bicolor S238N-H82]|uniref:Predicted protein n=1 Tax=Laccaria bicolor (strain S238N-H82 / ATCC MYA-4686) TaxID=486041 RepID=B0E4C9_LACBS|nr:uncharacterized protein LACBIDRAFT_336086 [Laccaria bicolor S238N-H82]EDQ98302.1 predicted protein [Laccaria bicolor S238N-H82]|eukprot:XP_001891047.1 predicted protein [Laccaria bicolor S238N-H82]